MLDVKRLRILREVAEAGSFSAAADSLHLTQSAVSQQIAALEREAGAILIDRNRGNLRLTDPGQALIGHTEAVLARLDEAEREVRETLNAIPPERRRVITSHDAFGYFGEAYGVAFVAPQGVSTEAEASARDVARIIQQIRREKAAAVFLENVTDQRLARRIAEETGARIGGTLYSDALSDASGPASTYIDMMRHNARTIAQALGAAS